MDAKVLLRDIHGLDASPWWPPAAGWWLLLLAIIFAVLAARFLMRFWHLRGVRWRRDAEAQLGALKRRMAYTDPKLVAGELSELIRRIAIARCGRRACAGLEGDDWLAWLKRNDPDRFDWPDEGRLLLDLPYAPSGVNVDPGRLERLINAARAWVHADTVVQRGTARPETIAQHV